MSAFRQTSPAAKMLQPRLRLLPAFVWKPSRWPSNTNSYSNMAIAFRTCLGSAYIIAVGTLHSSASIIHTFLAFFLNPKQAQLINTVY